MGGATGMVDAVGSLTDASEGAGDEWCDGWGGDDPAEMAMAGRVGDNGRTGGVGGSAETGISRNLSSERVSGDGGDGDEKGGGALDGGVHGGGVSSAAWVERGERRSSLSFVDSHRSSASLRLFLTRLAGGGSTSGGDGDGIFA
jgi:hypothetical protein